MAELLRVDDRADRLDLPICDVERHDADQLPFRIQVLGARMSVYQYATELDTADRLEAQPHPIDEHPSDLGAAEDRVLDRRRHPPAVAVQLDVFRQQRLEGVELSPLRRGKEALRERLPFLGRGIEARPAHLYLAPAA